ncbi:hypothetical protein Taro_052612 [Colocasia esculenta]|uniref:BHLH domain-containing protein n=1 Tax=Colocasia esculenta TaxID=4460 RepID=A0A843XJV3_COLES|nr:hypothetical protein [Colocasia esculenta]
MDLGGKDMFGMEKRSENHLSFHGSSMSSEWRLGDPQMGLVGHDASVDAVCQGDQMGGSSSCTSASIVDSFGHRHWGLPANSQGLAFCDAAVPSGASPAMVMPTRNPVAAPPRLDMGWNAPDSVPRRGMFLQNGAGMLPPSLQSQFPADSAFIERAARFSCFNGVSLGGMMSPFAAGILPGAQEQMNEGQVGESSQNTSMSADNTAFNGGSLHGVGIPGNDSGEPEFSGGGREGTPNSENTVGEPSSKGLSAKKRKRVNQDLELEQNKGDAQLSVETSKENVESKEKGSPSAKPGGKNGKDGGTDGGKEDYIHVRARRGQATNSHSLAERLRREKISERMKFLQDLVPGCSKVTGKAVMLDEIINYVQSLQRQVEFLSMKLAAVNPRLDFNIEGLLSKEILQSRAISSSTFGFSPDMAHHQIHPTQQALVQSGIPGIGNPSDAHRRSINAQLVAINAYKEPAAQIPNSWDDELHNVVQMGFSSNVALSTQDLHDVLHKIDGGWAGKKKESNVYGHRRTHPCLMLLRLESKK